MTSSVVYFIKEDDSLWGIGSDYTGSTKIMDGVKAASASMGLPLLILTKNIQLLAHD